MPRYRALYIIGLSHHYLAEPITSPPEAGIRVSRMGRLVVLAIVTVRYLSLSHDWKLFSTLGLGESVSITWLVPRNSPIF